RGNHLRGRQVIPNFPRRCGLVKLLQSLLVLERVHALPETGMLISQQSLFLNQALKGFPYQFFTRPNMTEYFVAHDEEPTVNPNVRACQSTNIFDHAVRSDLHEIETGRG